ncbi:aminotransferase class IV [Natranaerofaba carboxydovora]|uniref:aminotransferase class IV n=1 Tax=Natranaerofaba carboxydovora TaxID=2742683 RepID=UPI001F1305EF|nr:aminotransferase class IV [Natranaerofaba carboxydovora]UMZ73674.1 D-alanine aminotransferase [Natranaerofaba carboxydovora]
MSALAYINGNYVDLSKAKVDALDRGHIYGDGLYEVIAIENGQLYQIDEHLERYEQGAKEMLYENHPSSSNLKEISQNLIDKSKINKGMIYLQVTRGTAPRAHAFPKPQKPNVFLFVKELADPNDTQKQDGVKTTLVPDERWNRCHVKSINLLPNCFYKEKARQEGYFEAIQVDNSKITEGTSTNVFGIKDGIIYTAPYGSKVLRGITRETILKLAKQENITVKENFITVENFLNCDEVFITSTTIKLLPVKQVDEVSFSVNEYETTFLLQEKLEEYIEDECN